MSQMDIKQGDIYWVDFDPSIGTEIKKKRPALVCSCDIMNENCPRIIIAPITSNLNRMYAFEYAILAHKEVTGKVMLDQIRSIDKSRVIQKICFLSFKEMQEIADIIEVMVGKKSIDSLKSVSRDVTPEEFKKSADKLLKSRAKLWKSLADK